MPGGSPLPGVGVTAGVGVGVGVGTGWVGVADPPQPTSAATASPARKKTNGGLVFKRLLLIREDKATRPGSTPQTGTVQ